MSIEEEWLEDEDMLDDFDDDPSTNPNEDNEFNDPENLPPPGEQ